MKNKKICTAGSNCMLATPRDVIWYYCFRNCSETTNESENIYPKDFFSFKINLCNHGYAKKISAIFIISCIIHWKKIQSFFYLECCDVCYEENITNVYLTSKRIIYPTFNINYRIQTDWRDKKIAIMRVQSYCGFICSRMT